MRPIKNYEEVKNELAKILENFQRWCNSYQTDVYIYYDSISKNAKLDTFVNVGGNSWLDDDHIILYQDSQHDEREIEDTFTSIDELADALEMPYEDLEKAARKAMDLGDNDTLEWKDVIDDYIKPNDDLWDKLVDAALDYAKECGFDPEEEAETILQDFIQEDE